MRRTKPLVGLAIAFMENPDGRHWGYDLSKRANIRSGILYPRLRTMLDEGWLTDGWQDPDETRRGKPPRRYYELTDEGRRELGGMVADARSDPKYAGIFRDAVLHA